MNHSDEIAAHLPAWAPDYPRRVTRNQLWSDSHPETVRALLAAEDDPDDSPFISTYSFPRGHTTGDNIPRVNTLFIDFDFEDGEYEPGSGDRTAWQRDISHLLVRARKVAQVIQDSDRTGAWRASLSGHKGIHLFLDFPAIDPSVGTFNQFVQGMNDYATGLIRRLSKQTGLGTLEKYVDVTSSDLGRLCRVPNTLHSGATVSFGDERYCVPATIEEVATLTPEAYEELTADPRTDVEILRQPSGRVGEILTQHIETASSSARRSYGSGGTGSTVDWSRVERYQEQSNDSLTLEDARFLTSDMPCVWEFHERTDKFEHGNQSHEMESHCIAKLIESNFPTDVIHQFLSNAPQYDEEYTEQRIRELIARDFNPYRTEKLLRRAPEFCGYNWCARCQSVIDDDAELQQLHK